VEGIPGLHAVSPQAADTAGLRLHGVAAVVATPGSGDQARNQAQRRKRECRRLRGSGGRYAYIVDLDGDPRPPLRVVAVKTKAPLVDVAVTVPE